jgi:hypothetical protein
MRVRSRIVGSLIVLGLLLLTTAAMCEDLPAGASAAQTNTVTAGDPLLQLLVSKGVLNADEARSLGGTPGEQRVQLLQLLRLKGILSASDYEVLTAPSASAQVDANLVASTTPILPAAVTQTAAPKVVAETKPAGPGVIPAVTPVRVLPIDPPKREGLIPDIKIGNVRVKPYGFYKTSAVYDSSSPRGDDFPLPGFLNSDTGPDGDPAFHIKARAMRVGTNVEWLDPSSKLTLTGKLEFDFEGNFSRADNRNVSSIRSNMPQLRLGWARMDYATSDKDTVFALFGQDWTPFGSSTLPATIETTGVGIAFGSLYERAPQIRGGVVHNFGGPRTFKLSPEIAVVLPAFGNLPSDLGNQLGYGERQGTDSARPEVEARMVAQFQLDPAKGVAPAQLIVSGVQARRDAILLKSAIPLCVVGVGDCVLGTEFQTAFPKGYKATSERYGVSAEAQLPTRYVTLTGKVYRGADLRFFFAGQLFSNFNDFGGLSGGCGTIGTPAACEGLSVDGSSAVLFGFDASGNAVAAPQRPVRGYGAYGELGFPLSRIFNANPAGRNAGWSMNLHWGYDAVVASDVRQHLATATAGTRARSDWAFGNLQYKLNQYVTFAFEQSLYTTIAVPDKAGVFTTKFAGVPAREANDRRSEFATIFTF